MADTIFAAYPPEPELPVAASEGPQTFVERHQLLLIDSVVVLLVIAILLIAIRRGRR